MQESCSPYFVSCMLYDFYLRGTKCLSIFSRQVLSKTVNSPILLIQLPFGSLSLFRVFGLSSIEKTLCTAASQPSKQTLRLRQCFEPTSDEVCLSLLTGELSSSPCTRTQLGGSAETLCQPTWGVRITTEVRLRTHFRRSASRKLRILFPRKVTIMVSRGQVVRDSPRWGVRQELRRQQRRHGV